MGYNRALYPGSEKPYHLTEEMRESAANGRNDNRSGARTP